MARGTGAADALASTCTAEWHDVPFFAASGERDAPAHRADQRRSWLPMERGRPLLVPTAARHRSSRQPSTGSNVEKKVEHRLLRWPSAGTTTINFEVRPLAGVPLLHYRLPGETLFVCAGHSRRDPICLRWERDECRVDTLPVGKCQSQVKQQQKPRTYMERRGPWV